MPEKFEEWAKVELFGHQVIIGKVTEATLAGGAFLRVDVPKTAGFEAFTKFFGPNAIYAITPIGESLAKQLIMAVEATPVSRFELPQLKEKVSTDDDRDFDA